jgi:hypothetical protein
MHQGHAMDRKALKHLLGRVLVYVHHATAAKITAAVAIVDTLEARLANLSA